MTRGATSRPTDVLVQYAEEGKKVQRRRYGWLDGWGTVGPV